MDWQRTGRFVGDLGPGPRRARDLSRIDSHAPDERRPALDRATTSLHLFNTHSRVKEIQTVATILRCTGENARTENARTDSPGIGQLTACAESRPTQKPAKLSQIRANRGFRGEFCGQFATGFSQIRRYGTTTLRSRGCFAYGPRDWGKRIGIFSEDLARDVGPACVDFGVGAGWLRMDVGERPGRLGHIGGPARSDESQLCDRQGDACGR